MLLNTWYSRIAAFDLETTGLDLNESRIVTACVAELGEAGQLMAPPREWLVNPGVPIPPAATAVHGITNEVAQSAGLPPQQAIAEIVQTLDGYQRQGIPVAIFNAPYDLTILGAECDRYELPQPIADLIVDPLVIDRKFMQYRRGKRTLTVLAEAYGIELQNAHNSTSDAIAAGQLAQIQAAQFLPSEITVVDLHSQQKTWSDEQTASLEEFVRKANPAFVASYGWPVKLS